MKQPLKRITHKDRVWHYLKDKKHPVSAYDILADLRSDGITAATTIYRALDKLLADGLVHRIVSINAWVACCCSHHGETPIFEICDHCGKVTEYVDANLNQTIATLSKRSQFVQAHSIVEIHGHCVDCSQANMP